MQCKDIPTRPILEFLLRHAGSWHNWSGPEVAEQAWPNAEDKASWMSMSVRNAMPPGVPAKLVLAKMRILIRSGLVDGCDCGCRGDFEITDKGREYLSCTEGDPISVGIQVRS